MLTIAKAKTTTTKPIIALIIAFLPFSACSSLPAEVMYQNPPMIKTITETMPAKVSKNWITTNNKAVRLLEAAMPVEN
jgi:hypothetical protein